MCFPTNAEQYVHFRSFIFHLSGCCWLMTEKGGSARVVAVSVCFFLSESNSLAEPRFADTRNPGAFRQARILFFRVLASQGASQDAREGSEGAVVNQGRQERRPGVPRMGALLGAVGSLSDQSSN